MSQYKQAGDHIYKFDSPFEFIDYIGQPRPGGIGSEVSRSNTNFTGVETYEDAKKVSFEGFDVSDVVATLSELEESFEAQEVATRHDVQGAFVDVGAYMTGEPECMIDFVETEKPNSAVKIVFDICESYKITIKQMINRAACLAGVVSHLEKEGIPTEVHLLMPNELSKYYGRGTLTGVFIKIKEVNERLNINLLTGVLHPAFFRRIYLSFIEKVYPVAVEGGYGHVGITGEPINKLLTKAGFTDVENIITAGTVTTMGGFDTFESIKQNAEKMIKQINLKLNL
jgi:hypothetical protein